MHNGKIIRDDEIWIRFLEITYPVQLSQLHTRILQSSTVLVVLLLEIGGGEGGAGKRRSNLPNSLIKGLAQISPMLVSPKAVLVTNTGAQTVVWREVPGVCKTSGPGRSENA